MKIIKLIVSLILFGANISVCGMSTNQSDLVDDDHVWELVDWKQVYRMKCHREACQKEFEDYKRKFAHMHPNALSPIDRELRVLDYDAFIRKVKSDMKFGDDIVIELGKYKCYALVSLITQYNPNVEIIDQRDPRVQDINELYKQKYIFFSHGFYIHAGRVYLYSPGSFIWQ